MDSTGIRRRTDEPSFNKLSDLVNIDSLNDNNIGELRSLTKALDIAKGFSEDYLSDFLKEHGVTNDQIDVSVSYRQTALRNTMLQAFCLHCACTQSDVLLWVILFSEYYPALSSHNLITSLILTFFRPSDARSLGMITVMIFLFTRKTRLEDASPILFTWTVIGWQIFDSAWVPFGFAFGFFWNNFPVHILMWVYAYYMLFNRAYISLINQYPDLASQLSRISTICQIKGLALLYDFGATIQFFIIAIIEYLKFPKAPRPFEAFFRRLVLCYIGNPDFETKTFSYHGTLGLEKLREDEFRLLKLNRKVPFFYIRAELLRRTHSSAEAYEAISHVWSKQQEYMCTLILNDHSSWLKRAYTTFSVDRARIFGQSMFGLIISALINSLFLRKTTQKKKPTRSNKWMRFIEMLDGFVYA
jgi:hypothetical protein